MRRQVVLILMLILFSLMSIQLLNGCTANRFMLDDPVNDPIMSTDDQQDLDLCKVEDGGFGGAGGECPT